MRDFLGYIGSDYQNSTILHSASDNDFHQSNSVVSVNNGSGSNGEGIGNPSPKIGVYNVKSGSVIHPATVNPNVLRSYSSASSFKPILPIQVMLRFLLNGFYMNLF